MTTFVVTRDERWDSWLLSLANLARKRIAFHVRDCYLTKVRVERGCPPPGPFTRTFIPSA
jgi:hypothetical protein